ncbi:MAG: hypothetical protein EB117_12895 [Betaproteobacteria bacterium]|nr:hypothetical protein [Betaproteobacteria bacterium]
MAKEAVPHKPALDLHKSVLVAEVAGVARELEQELEVAKQPQAQQNRRQGHPLQKPFLPRLGV